MKKQIYQAIEASIKAGATILEVYNSKDFEIQLKSDNSPLTLADRRAHEIIVKHLNSTGIPILSEEGKDIPFEERSKWHSFWLVDPLDGTKEFIKRNGEFTVNIALVEGSQPVAGVIYVPVSGTLFFGMSDQGAYRVINAEHILHKNGKPNWIHLADSIPEKSSTNLFRVVASRSHMNTETEEFVQKLKASHENVEIVSKGSSLKLCLIAEGKADIYPRFGPTSEWDTAAGHAIINASGGKVVLADDSGMELNYNKQNILNPYFIAIRNKSGN